MNQDFDKETISSSSTDRLTRRSSVSDLEVVPQIENLPEVDQERTFHITQTRITRGCDICSRPSSFQEEVLACHSRGRFNLALCQVHLEEGQYFEIVNRRSKDNCQACSRHLRSHTPIQLLGCWAYDLLTRNRIQPVDYLPGADVNWPAENTHKAHLRGG